MALSHPPRMVSLACALQPDYPRVVGVPPVDPGALPWSRDVAHLLSMSYKRGCQLVVLVGTLVRWPEAVALLG